MTATFDFMRGQLPAELKTRIETIGAVVDHTYLDGSATIGAATANTYSGRNTMAAAAATCVITNSLVTTSSVVIVQVETDDVVAVTMSCVPTNGSFTVTSGDGVATANTKFRWFIAGGDRNI